MWEIVFKKESNGMQRWNIVALASGGRGSTWPGQRFVYPLIFLLLQKGNILETQLLTQLGLRQESDNLKGGILWRSQGEYTLYLSLNQCRDICIPSQFFDFSSYGLLDEILSVIPSI